MILGIWFIATIAKQLNWRWCARLVSGRIFDLLPAWNFFAPNPGQADIRLVYRDRSESEFCTGWEEICLQAVENRWRFLWNPARLRLKALIDLGVLLCQLQEAEKDNPDMILFTSPYLALLDRAMAETRLDPSSRSRQFAILASRGASAPRSLERLFVSRWHDLA